MHTFVPGAIASAQEVNENFQELNSAISQKASQQTSTATNWASGWSNSKLQVYRVGTLYLLTGIIARTNNAAITSSRYLNIATISPRPSATLYGDVFSIPAVGYVKGHVTPAQNSAAIEIETATGRLTLNTAASCTYVSVSGVFVV